MNINVNHLEGLYFQNRNKIISFNRGLVIFVENNILQDYIFFKEITELSILGCVMTFKYGYGRSISFQLDSAAHELIMSILAFNRDNIIDELLDD